MPRKQLNLSLTKEYLTSFKAGDVLMVVLRCVRCGGESSFPVKGNLKMSPIAECHVCGKGRDHSEKSRDPIREASGLLQALRNASTNADADNMKPDKTTWNIRLVMEGGPSSAREDG